ncbi:aminopeptidase P family protein [Arachidicoccus sp.]|uniref:aminopeptidase P family protein n=1 Tax=Arachidicoccus sp. TaxID=1872624 RepID=UPI003D221125
MFNAEIYQQRRSQLKSKVKSGIILLMGNEQVGMNFLHNGYTFRQDSSFLYYVGIDLPHLGVIIDIDNDTETLFGDDLTIDDIIWTGPQASMKDWAGKTAISEVKKYKAIISILQSAYHGGRTIHFLPPYRDEHTLKLHEWLGMPPQVCADKASVELIKTIVSMRSYKQPEEIEEMEKAVDISAEMHELFMKSVRPGKTELEVAGLVEGLALSSGGQLAYPAILTASGETLHIHARNVVLESGQMALCDIGAETAMHYAGDLTRTAPVNGKFTDLQKDMYNMILAIQLAAIDACKPGTLYKDIHALSGEMLLEGLKSFGIIKGDVKEALAADAHTLFFQCGLGHMIGLDVHDMENLGEQYVGYTQQMKKQTNFGWKSLRLGRALEPGFTITVEPGIYFIPTLIDIWKSKNKLANFINYSELEKFKTFGGIRIEDEVLITEKGNRILGNKMPPKTVAEMEAIQQQ